MNRRSVGSQLILAAAVLYAARHLGAMIFMANKTGELGVQYNFGLQAGGTELLPLSVAALLLGLLFLAWGELSSRKGRD